MSIFDALFEPMRKRADLKSQISKLSMQNINLEQTVQALKEELQLRNEETRGLRFELDRRCENPVDHRYWEGRYRDEKDECDKWQARANEAVAAANALQIEVDRLRAQVANMETEGPKRDLEKFNDAQAARAMSRNTKQNFQAYQAAVKIMLDRLNDLGKANHVTKEDLRKLRQLRIDLGNQINREI